MWGAPGGTCSWMVAMVSPQSPDLPPQASRHLPNPSRRSLQWPRETPQRRGGGCTSQSLRAHRRKGPPQSWVTVWTSPCSSGCSAHRLWHWGWGAPSRVVAQAGLRVDQGSGPTEGKGARRMSAQGEGGRCYCGQSGAGGTHSPKPQLKFGISEFAAMVPGRASSLVSSPITRAMSKGQGPENTKSRKAEAT